MVDIMAAMGAARKIPAANGGSTFTIRVGMTRSGTVRSGITARPSAPARCIPNIRIATTIVPIMIPRCTALLSLYEMQRTAVCGRPITPKHTSTQNEVIKAGERMSSAPCGETSFGSIASRVSTAWLRPPAACTIPTSRTRVPMSITIPCIVSLSTLARNPPNAVYSAILTPKMTRPVS